MTTPNESTAAVVRLALVETLRGTRSSGAAQAAAAAVLQAYLHERPATAADDFARVFAVRTNPGNLVGRWLSLGDPTESWARTFNRGGAAGTCTVHAWHTPVAGDDVGDGVAMELWRLIALVLSYPLDLDEHRMLSGVATLVTVLADPDGRSWHAVVNYATNTQPDPTP